MPKKNKGITLISLVVTIIILIILAGVSIYLISGSSGILGRATASVDKNNIETAKEQVTLKIGEYQSDFYEGRYVTREIGNEVQQGDWIYEKCGKGEKVSTKNYKFTITLPEGKEAVDTENPYIVTIQKNRRLPGNVTGTLSLDGKLEWDEIIVASSGSEEENPGDLPENTPETDAGTPVALKDGWTVETMRYVKLSDGRDVEKVDKVATVYAISDGAGNTVPVPYEFYYVGGTVDTGVVISDNEDDSYLKNKRDMTSHGDAKNLKGNQFVWVPCSLENYTKRDWGYSNNSWDTSTNTAEETQIQKYGGFYVGRYEAGTSKITLLTGVDFSKTYVTTNFADENFVSKYANGDITTKAGEIPYYHADYTTAVEMSERMYYNTSYVHSGLMTGTQWDVMLNWMSNESESNKKVENAGNASYYADLKSNCTWGNYNNTTLNNCTGKILTTHSFYLTITADASEEIYDTNGNRKYGILTTGSTEDVKKKNIYDIAGNLFEWTQENGSSSAEYVLRGGGLSDPFASRPACWRQSYPANSPNSNIGFRPVLYMK